MSSSFLRNFTSPEPVWEWRHLLSGRLALLPRFCCSIYGTCILCRGLPIQVVSVSPQSKFLVCVVRLYIAICYVSWKVGSIRCPLLLLGLSPDGRIRPCGLQEGPKRQLGSAVHLRGRRIPSPHFEWFPHYDSILHLCLNNIDLLFQNTSTIAEIKVHLHIDL